MANQVKFKKEYLQSKGLPYDGTLRDRIVEHGRWTVTHDIIFEDNGKYYSAFYDVGATEAQYTSPWEYEDEIECIEMHQVEELVKVWKIV